MRENRIRPESGQRVEKRGGFRELFRLETPDTIRWEFEGSRKTLAGESRFPHKRTTRLRTGILAAPLLSFLRFDGKSVPGYDSGDRELAEMALAAWSRESAGHLKFVPATQEASALVRVRWISASDGLYGETQRTVVNGKPGAAVNVSPSVAGLGEPISTMASKDRLLRDTIVYLTCVHETGHALGLQHTRNFEDIMYAFGYGGDIVEYFSRYRRNIKSRADIARISGVSPGDVKVLKSLC